MDSFEKLDRAIALKSTPEIPVYPHIITFAGRCAGITQEKLLSSNKAWLDACEKTFERIGRPDVVFPMNPWDTAYIESMKLKKAVEVGTDAIIKLGVANAKRAKGDRVAIFAMRSSASFLSPKLFDEISFPSLKRMMEGYHAAGPKSVLHCDGNWDLMIPRLKELPRATCVVELDGATDIRKAREILDGHMCIKGDVHHTLLSLGTKEEVGAYCRDFLDFMGHEGGFILGSGCEVPTTAKPEIVAAMISAVRT